MDKITIERETLLPCPFCGDDGDKGRQEVTQMIEGRNKFARITCRACGAMCPEENWNRRAALAQKAEPPSMPQGKSLALLDLDSVEHMQGGANGPTIRLRGFINAQTGPTAPQPPIDNAFVADGCEQFSPPAEPAPVPCCGKYETCSHACTPRGRWLGRREAENERAESAQPLQNCLDVLETVTKHFTRTPSTLRDSQVRGMAHAAMKECRAAMIEAALQKIGDFGQDQAMTPDVLISKLANLRAMAAGRNVPEVDLATIDLAIDHLRYFSVTPSHRLSDARMDGIYNAWRDMGDDVSYGDLMRMVEAEIQGGK